MDTTKFDKFDRKTFVGFSNISTIEKDLQTLLGILEGINSDQIITDKELKALQEWINSNKQYEEKNPYKEVITLIRTALNDNILTTEEVDNIKWFCNQYLKRTEYFDAITSDIQQLTGLIHGITIDNEINHKELEYLDKWLEENSQLKNTWPYDELYNLVTSIIQDKIITQIEHDALLNFSNAITGRQSNETNSAIFEVLKTGFYQIDPEINIQEQTFCITGVSKKYKRREIAERIELFGGIVVDNVSSKLNYLIVCDEKNSCWAFTCYGRKIEEAIKHRKQGINLIIVHEYDLHDALESLSS